MLPPRTETILKSIVGQYITRARPVPSQSITNDYELGVSSATVRNEMTYLEEEGYITRPHHSAGSIPLDKGYRHYVETLGDVRLPLVEQRLISHLFHQVEKDLDEWLDMAASLIAQMVQNAVIITMPKTQACQFKHLELVRLQDSLGLVIVILNGANIKQELITFDRIISQAELTTIANKLSAAYSGLTGPQILVKNTGFLSLEQQLTDCLLKVMEAEDKQEYEELNLHGLHFTLSQPEFTRNHRIALTLMELAEQHNLLRSVIPSELSGERARVIIGKENKTEAIHDYSVVIIHYGLPQEAVGVIGVIGPTRMPYARTIATIDYVSSVLSTLAAKLYGRETPAEANQENTN